MKRVIFILYIFLICSTFGTYAAPLENIPIKILQPDGMEIWCYTSGDEFYHWLHDKDGNIIIKDSVSNYYCYRMKESDSLVVVNNNQTPHALYVKYSLDFNKEHEKNVKMYNSTKNIPYTFVPSRSGSPRTINNIVVYIRFADQNEFSVDTVSTICTRHNDSTTNANSMKQYYWESSYHQLIVNTTFFPNGTSVYSYQDTYPRAYYCPYSNNNPIGYSTVGNARKYREDSLLVRAITYIESQIPATLDIDTDNDGRVDNICFIIKGGTTSWNTLLWPHKWSLWQYKVINGKRVYNYNLQLSDYIISHGVGVLCHEFGHTLGAPDLYHYKTDSTGYKWNPVGRWDIMASNGVYPQQTSGYIKYKYFHWINAIPEITQSGRYSLSTIATSNQCYKINMEGSTTEFLYLEYRNKNYPYEQYIPNNGLVISRINPLKRGNSNAINGGGKEDEIYIYRPNGTFTNDGNINHAPFCVELNSTSFNPTTNPHEFLSNGEMGNIYISNVSECDSTISFYVKICTAENVTYDPYSVIPSYTNAETITTMGNIIINNDSTLFEASENVTLNGGFTIPLGKSFTAEIKPCE